ncbi:hypothetical protein [Nostoc sp.]|uniref:hypothetical protein n=1 Tax=Nostoc sp. TaxID=1180 RepID=UPI002FFB1E6E
MTINNLSEDDICLPKDTLILNTLAMGIAIQILAKITGETIETWKDYVGVTAEEQYRQLSAQEIQKIVDELTNLKACKAPDEAS